METIYDSNGNVIKPTIEAVFTIVGDTFGDGKRVGQKLVLFLEYLSEIHTPKVTQRVSEWANGCIVNQEIINPDKEG